MNETAQTLQAVADQILPDGYEVQAVEGEQERYRIDRADGTAVSGPVGLGDALRELARLADIPG